jgi:hypothetical protein
VNAGASEQQKSDHLASFTGQHVERPACGAGVHDLETDAGLQKLRAKKSGWKDLPATGPEQNDFRCEREDAGGVLERQVGNRKQIRGGAEGQRRDDHGAAERVGIDPQLAIAIAANEVESGVRVLGEAHAAKIPKVPILDEVVRNDRF